MIGFQAASARVAEIRPDQGGRAPGAPTELTGEEIELVHGGVGPTGVAVGAIVGGYRAYHNGGNAGQIVAGAIFGGVTGFFGGLGMWGSAAVTGIMGSFVGGGGVWAPGHMKAR